MNKLPLFALVAVTLVGSAVFAVHPATASAAFVDLKINGSNNPAPVVLGTPVVLTWPSSGVGYCNTGSSPAYPMSWGSYNYAAVGQSATFIPTVAGTLRFGIQCSLSSTTPMFVSDWIALTAVNPTIAITTPNGGEILTQGQSHNITWTSSVLPNINEKLILIDYSGTKPVVTNIAIVSSNTNSYAWKVPTVTGNKFKVAIMYDATSKGGGYVEDLSDNYFSIVAPSIVTVSPQIISAGESIYLDFSPRPSQSWTLSFTCPSGAWITNGGCTELATYAKDFALPMAVQAENNTNADKIITAIATVGGKTSQASFTVRPRPTPSITVTSPNGGEILTQGQTINIAWTSSNFPSDTRFNIDLLDGTLNSQYHIADTLASSGTYSWTVPNSIMAAVFSGTKFKMYIYPVLASYSSNDSSDNYFSITAPAVTGPSLAVSKNVAYPDQTASPNMTGVKIGSFLVKNISSISESVKLTSLTINLGGSESITNISALRTSVASGSGLIPIAPSTMNTFAINDILAPGASEIIDIFGNTGSQTNVTVITSMTVSSVGMVSNTSETSSVATGQTITFNNASLSASLVTSSTTPAQYIAATGGATNATQATYNFTSTGGAVIITELKFTVTGSDFTPSQTIANICVGSICGPSINNTVWLMGLNLSVPNGGAGLTQSVLVSYSDVSYRGIASGTTSSIALTYVKYTTGATMQTLAPSISAPTMTLVGSKPTVTGNGTSNGGLIIGAENKIGEVTVTADTKGNIKLNDIKFNVVNSGFSVLPTFTGARIAIGNTTVTGSVCTQGPAMNISQTIFCEFGTSSNTDFDGYTIAAGQSVTFNLFATVIGAPGVGATISSSLNVAGFNWDDTSTNGVSGTNNTGTLIYGFPTNSYSIHN